MVEGRWATQDDQHLLDSFVCAPDGVGQREPWSEDVQRWVRELLDWMSEAPDHRVRLYEDETGLVAVMAWRLLDADQPQAGFYLYIMAVRYGNRGIGKRLVNGLMGHLRSEAPDGIVVWKVDPKNGRSAALSGKYADDEPRSDPERPHFLEYSVSLTEQTDA